MKYWLCFLVIGCCCCKTPRQPASPGFSAFDYSIQKKVMAGKGIVVSAHPLASKAGVAMMKKGGNAFDAAIATQLALAVVYPGAGNIGGGGFMVARTANGKMISLDFREKAPASAHKDMYLDSSGNVLPDKSTRGPGSSGVPGTVAGLIETLQYARLDWQTLIQPAIDLAENGFALTSGEARALNALQPDLTKYNRSQTAFQKTTPWAAGDTLVQKDLAATLKRIRDQRAKGFYEGETARLIAEEMNSAGGHISTEDLRNYSAKWREPHRFEYKGYEVVTMGLPSSGGVLLQQMLGMLEKKRLDTFTFQSSGAVQLITEVERRAYADRAQYLGDPDFTNVQVQQLVDPVYLDQRMKDFIPGKAGRSDLTRAGALPRAEKEQTTHISIIDNEGNAVSVTTTLNDSYGSRTVVSGAGFLLNNEMDDFSIKPGEPNIYGAVGGEANAIAPGKRMLSSMSPTIVLQKDAPFLVAGTPGGTTIPTSVLQTLVNIIDFGMNTTAAVNAPKFHHQWLPDRIDVESSFPPKIRSELESMGYHIAEREQIGSTEVIRVMPDKSFEGVADERGEDSAEGW